METWRQLLTIPVAGLPRAEGESRRPTPKSLSFRPPSEREGRRNLGLGYSQAVGRTETSVSPSGAKDTPTTNHVGTAALGCPAEQSSASSLLSAPHLSAGGPP